MYLRIYEIFKSLKIIKQSASHSLALPDHLFDVGVPNNLHTVH